MTWLEDPSPWLRHAYCFASDFTGPTSKGSDGRGRGEKGKGRGGNEKGKGRKGRQTPPSPFPIRYATGSGEPFAASGTVGDLIWLEDFLTSK